MLKWIWPKLSIVKTYINNYRLTGKVTISKTKLLRMLIHLNNVNYHRYLLKEIKINVWRATIVDDRIDPDMAMDVLSKLGTNENLNPVYDISIEPFYMCETWNKPGYNESMCAKMKYAWPEDRLQLHKDYYCR